MSSSSAVLNQQERSLDPDLPKALEVRNLAKTYPKGIVALDGISFSVMPGTIFALLGPNGAGKSTTVKILCTLSLPTSGEALVLGVDVLRQPNRVRHLLGWVGQKSGADVAASARENLALQGKIYGLHGHTLNTRVSELLDQFGLAAVADRPVRTYSGGMQRKLDIALSLVHRPKLLFLDEPTSSLDPASRVDIWSELFRLSSTQSMTMFLTTHYLEEADQVASHLAIVDRGKLIASGTPEGLKSELFGDSVHVYFKQAEAEGPVRKALEQMTGLREVVVEAKALHVRASQGTTAAPVLLAALELQGVGVSSVKVARPSLNDVYLRHTGRVFSETAGEK